MASSNITWGGLPVRTSSVSKAFWTVSGYAVAALGVLAIIPSIALGPIGSFLKTPLTIASHGIDRMKNGAEAKEELEYRAKYYSPQIFKTLGVQAREGRQATIAEFKAAASMNPELAKLYSAPVKKKDKENRNSAMTNAGFYAASYVTLGASDVVAGASKLSSAVSGTIQAAKTILPSLAGGMAGGALANAISGDVVDPQEYLEAIHKTGAEASARGMNLREVITPQMIFLLRVSQDPQFADSLKKNYKKPFHKMNEAEQTQVMQAYPALANAATSEAYALANNMLQVQELGASKPNLNGRANQYAVGSGNSSFADRLRSQRAAAASVAPTAPAI